MSDFHLRQIKAYLHKYFDGKVSLSDMAGMSDAEAEPVFLARSLAAMILMNATGISVDEAAGAVTDGTGDNGVDAVYFLERERLLVLVHSAWLPEETESLSREEVRAFLAGFTDLINARFARFNDKFRARTRELEAALETTAKILLIVAHSGIEPLSPEARMELDEVRADVNDTSEVLFVATYRQSDIYRDVTHGIQGAPIDFDVIIYGWGLTDEPFRSVYGQVATSDVARWWKAHYPRLFSPNIRVYLGDTDVNSGILDTLRDEPENFWYYNNGITALCSGFEKKALGGDDRKSGTFECCNVRIVNGAQTVGSIAAAAEIYPENVKTARVPIRFISLANCPEGFDRDVTRYNNTQNRIDRRDFVTLDPEHERIRNELALDGVAYVYKSGDAVPPGEEGFDLGEATVARACFMDDVTYAVQAKREIGRLWNDIDKEPYTLLFNPEVSGPSLWRLVEILRIVESVIKAVGENRAGRDHLLAAHANRLVAHLVFRALPPGMAGATEALSEGDAGVVEREATRILEKVIAISDELFPNQYPASLFRTLGKCRQIIERMQEMASPA